MTISAFCAAVTSSSPFRRPVPCCTMTLKSGTKRLASLAQLPTTEVGATTRVGFHASASPSVSWAAFSTASRDNSCSVLPKPMSSASTAPMLLRDIQYSQSTPRRWYSRSSAWTVSGISTRSGAVLSSPPSSEVCHSEPVKATGSSAIDFKAISRRSASVTASSCSPSLNSLRRRSTSATSSSQPGCSSWRAISAVAASCSSSFRARWRAVSANSRMYCEILFKACVSAITHSPRRRIRPDLEEMSSCISASVSCVSPTESFQS